ncbi:MULTISPECIES: type III-A CRISPR-associated RAMP protein Csm3 [unclassified Neisseria]|uniref:type III-A CRISPR-associated RAMP protein Csm3 n=1 Tax=unclassified Neisseria TaxID=2623750 RepID=UPI00107256E3|nr:MULTISPECIES: type III-A CRISPR-associated RAMP protein Csm3 [unclassified Neisseria]MBF0804289.1 type III-A CRISPR-associated RAMP protein Csm3 [Neisseria sp. 19428wB4_WF04]TFU42964.1 type III-A CRISPR-associated RAMP protein Csm3 [Neisseria sp. WF04]
MELANIHILEAKLVLQTGLHIGAGDSEIHIGGIDNSVIKHPVGGEPYIPGSSLKGKIRSLLEWKSGVVQEAPLGKREYETAQGAEKTAVKHILQLFGISGDSQSEALQQEIGHTRVSFWDCGLNPDYAQRLREDNLLFTEVKSETMINRIRCRKFQRCLHFPFFACRPILGFLRVVKNAERHGEAASFLRMLENHETIIPVKKQKLFGIKSVNNPTFSNTRAGIVGLRFDRADTPVLR